MASLAILHHEEGVRVNPERLVELYRQLGEAGAEQVVVRAIEELGARLIEMQRFVDEGKTASLLRSARLLIKAAEQIGMMSFARVAGDVVRATEAGDHAAQAATLARLMRIGDRSLNAVWDLRDMTI